VIVNGVATKKECLRSAGVEEKPRKVKSTDDRFKALAAFAQDFMDGYIRHA